MLGGSDPPPCCMYLLVHQHDLSRIVFMNLPWSHPIKDRTHSFVHVLLIVQAALVAPFPLRDATELLNLCWH